MKNIEPSKELEDAVALCANALKEAGCEPSEYRVIEARNLVVKGGQYKGPQYWKLTFKLRSLIPGTENGIIGVGGEIFVEADTEKRCARITGYGE